MNDHLPPMPQMRLYVRIARIATSDGATGLALAAIRNVQTAIERLRAAHASAAPEKPRCANCNRELDLILYVPGDRCADCLDDEVAAEQALADGREFALLDDRLRRRP